MSNTRQPLKKKKKRLLKILQFKSLQMKGKTWVTI